MLERQLPDLDMLGVIGLSPMGLQAATALLAARPADAPFGYMLTANAQVLVLLAQPDHPLRAAYDAAWIRLTDGQIPRFLARIATGRRFPLAAGSDMTVLLLRQYITPEDDIAIIGGAPDLPDELRKRYNLGRIHLHDPPMGYMEKPEAVAAALGFVRAHPARFVFVATGVPRSEAFLLRLLQEGGVTGTGLAVGSSLRFAVGEVSRAPGWMRASGLEWLFRLLSEPRRLWRRYAVESSPIFLLAWRAWRSGR